MTRLLIGMIALLGMTTPAVAQDTPDDPVDGTADDEEVVSEEPVGEDEEPNEAPTADIAETPPADDVVPEDAAPGDAAPEDADDSSAAAQADPAPADDADDAEDPEQAPKADPDDTDDGGDDAGDVDDDAGDVDDDVDDDVGDVDDDAPTQKPAKAVRAQSADPLTAFREKKYAQARDAYLDRLDERPNAPALHYRVAVSAALADDPVVAEKHAAAVERLDPGNLKAQELAAAARVARTRANPQTLALSQAQGALRDGRLRSAIRLATAALAGADANTGGLHRVRGEALLALGRADEAMDALQSAAAAGHTDARLWLALGDAAKSVGDNTRAAYLYTLAAQSAAPSDPVVDAAAKRRKRLGKTRRR